LKVDFPLPRENPFKRKAVNEYEDPKPEVVSERA
jgi:hypothetical protein